MTTPAAPRPLSHRLVYLGVIAVWVIYCVFGILRHPGADKLNLTPSQQFLILGSVYAIVLVIWLLAARGALHLRRYAELIHGSRDAPAMRLIANGLFWGVIYIMVITLNGVLISYAIGTPYLRAAVFLRNHIPPVVALIAFIQLYRGSSLLKQTVLFHTWTRGTYLMLAAYGVFACLLVLAFSRTTTNVDAIGVPIYVVPRPVALLTIIFAYLVVWLLGILSGINVAKYASQVKGTIYRKSLTQLVRGILIIVFMAAAIQVIGLIGRIIGGWSTQWSLLIVYTLLLMYGVGYWLVSAGAKRLTRLEGAE